MQKSRLVLLAAVLVTGGCYSVNTVENADTTAQVRSVPDHRVTWDQTLAGKFQMGQIIETEIGGLRKIQIPLTNNYAYHQECVYLIVWSDQNGMLIDTGNSWHRFHLEAHESGTISEIAPTPNAHDFVIKFQEPKFHQGIF
jgi:uncharacterized protein YcfL